MATRSRTAWFWLFGLLGLVSCAVDDDGSSGLDLAGREFVSERSRGGSS